MTGVIDKLDVWGPGAPSTALLTLEQAQAYTRQLAETHYENFPVASRLLPAALRQHFCNIYAYCRWADDLGDETGDRQRALELLSWWREELADCYGGRTQHPVFVALAETIREFAIPSEPFRDLISAFEQDQRVTEYATFTELEDYCRRSANPVGRLVLYLCRAPSPARFVCSDSICTGLQLANFWQDVARDAEIGRVYLPREDRERFGYTDGDLSRRVTNQAFVDLMTFEVDRAREYLVAGWPLVDSLEGRVQVDVELFIRGGLQILDEIGTIRYCVWDQRPVVSPGRFAVLFLLSIASVLRRRLRRTLAGGRPG